MCKNAVSTHHDFQECIGNRRVGKFVCWHVPLAYKDAYARVFLDGIAMHTYLYAIPVDQDAGASSSEG